MVYEFNDLGKLFPLLAEGIKHDMKICSSICYCSQGDAFMVCHEI